jgi:hypothetical protein
VLRFNEAMRLRASVIGGHFGRSSQWKVISNIKWLVVMITPMLVFGMM